MFDFTWGVVFISLCIGGGYAAGSYDRTKDQHQKCVAKYSDMPFNKVREHCTELLKFKK